jgi:uncharacterized protein (DUF488 family)
MHGSAMRVFTIGHGTRPAEELVDCLAEVGVLTLVDVRRFPGSRRNPQYNRAPLAAALDQAGVAYVHAEELGGRRRGEASEGRFACIREPAFRSYAGRMGRPEWQQALAEPVAAPSPCFMCAETPWQRCHRRLIADLLAARGYEVVHLLGPGRREPHRPSREAEYRGGNLFLCGHFVA